MNKPRALDADNTQVAAVAKKSKVNREINVQLSDQTVTSNDERCRNQFNPITTESLQQLLDFSHLFREQCIKARFDVILKLEFYLQKAGCHEDPYIRGGEEQKISGRWYFHRPPRRSADSTRSVTTLTDYYEGGLRKGLDVTIDGLSSSITTLSPPRLHTSHPPLLLREIPPLPHGGIPLRSIPKLGPKPQVIPGPSLLVDQILLLNGAASISELVETKWAGERSAFLHTDNPGADTPSFKLYLEYSPLKKDSPGLKIYNSPRIGLDLSHPGTTGLEVNPLHSRIRFLPKRHRYFTNPSALVANGGTQTSSASSIHAFLMTSTRT
ncbi:hypothetical protein K443DRAFT_7599 [Laccaria amethystina LaAM-08-1]|uniref:Uncharacterized protein n=1 Tax=Laccaria amethystina LaAM-08-1 TaxID=1095629 RepID=A0A0C9XS56_9AGAR|nr:hypothetical protein K443DRAFT_7599 [Laccaria amethystina LaAM-08-1]